MSGKPRSNAIPWTAFLLGAGASIAANVAHAAERNAEGTDIGAMLFAAWAPVALLLVAEMMVRGQRPRGLLTVVEWVGAFLVALAAAVVSYGHMRGLLLQYGESELVAVLLPLSVDGLVVVASVALAAGRRNKAEQRKAEQSPEQQRKAEQQDEEQSPEQSPERKEERKEEREEERNPEQRNPERKTEQRKVEERKDEEQKAERNGEQQRNEERKTEERKTEERKPEQQWNKPEPQRDEERKVRVPVVEVGSPTTVPVTVTPPHSAERRSAVEWVAEQLRNGATLTGAEIGARYGRTDRWGRSVLRDARQQLAATVPA